MLENEGVIKELGQNENKTMNKLREDLGDKKGVKYQRN